MSLFHPVSRHVNATAASPPALVLIRQTQLQSAEPLIDHLITSAQDRGEPVYLLSPGERSPTIDHSRGFVFVADFGEDDCGSAGPSSSETHFARLQREVQSNTTAGQPASIIINSVDALLDHAASLNQDAARYIYRQLRMAVTKLNGYSTLYLVTSNPTSASLQPELERRFLNLIFSPQFLRTEDTAKAASTSGSLFQVIQLHPPAIWRHILLQYGTGLRPASTKSRVARQLNDLHSRSTEGLLSNAKVLRTQRRDVSAIRAATNRSENFEEGNASALYGLLDEDSDTRATDPRLWSILAHLSAHADLSGPGAWFNDYIDDLQGEEVEAIRPACEGDNAFIDGENARITLQDLLGYTNSNRSKNETQLSRSGWGIVTSQHRLPGGKFEEEALGVVYSRQGGRTKLRLLPLDMKDRRSAAQMSNAGDTKNRSAGDSHSSLINSLPFNLSLTDEQRNRRGNVDLPFAPTDQIYEGYAARVSDAMDEAEEGKLRRGTTGQSTIYFEPDSGDEEDEEDPDDF